MGTEVVEVRIVDGNQLYFRSSGYGGAFAPIESIRLTKEGAVKEFPDLAGDVEWKSKSIDRLKKHLESLSSDDEKIKYIINDLSKYGYIPYAIQKQGHRVMKAEKWLKQIG